MKRWPVSWVPKCARPMLEVRMTMGGAGSASSALAIANPVPAAGVTSMIATSGRCARGRYHLVAGPEAGCDIDAFGAQQRYESGAGDLVIVDDDDPGRPPTGAGGAGWHDEWWAPAEGCSTSTGAAAGQFGVM